MKTRLVILLACTLASVHANAAAQEPSPAAARLVTVSVGGLRTTTFPPGAAFTVLGEGFPANAKVSVTFRQDADVALGNVTTSPQGALQLTADVPEAARPGDAAVVAESGALSVSHSITVGPTGSPSASIPATNRDIGVYAIAGVLLLVLGGLFIFFAGRRREGETSPEALHNREARAEKLDVPRPAVRIVDDVRSETSSSVSRLRDDVRVWGDPEDR